MVAIDHMFIRKSLFNIVVFISPQAGSRHVKMSRCWSCCDTKFLESSKKIPTVMTVAVQMGQRDVIQMPIIKRIFEHKWLVKQNF